MMTQKPWTPDSLRRKLTPPEVARLWGISLDSIMTWIRNGELRAINVAKRLGGRPRYRIDVKDLADFENRRAVQPPPPIQRRSRRRKYDNVTQYF
jgi:excisionase family DNA binding protein